MPGQLNPETLGEVDVLQQATNVAGRYTNMTGQILNRFQDSSTHVHYIPECERILFLSLSLSFVLIALSLETFQVELIQ